MDKQYYTVDDVGITREWCVACAAETWHICLRYDDMVCVPCEYEDRQHPTGAAARNQLDSRSAWLGVK